MAVLAGRKAKLKEIVKRLRAQGKSPEEIRDFLTRRLAMNRRALATTAPTPTGAPTTAPATAPTKTTPRGERAEFTRLVKEAENILAGSGYTPFIKEGLRSSQRQAQLYAQGRTRPGNIVTYARPGQSTHETGRAVDIWFKDKYGREISPDEAAKRGLYRRIAPAAKRIGFSWGGDWRGFVDQPHFQLI
jgi:peptidoglycan L-alanyl-D-glutamate endopeptidase CwlK